MTAPPSKTQPAPARLLSAASVDSAALRPRTPWSRALNELPAPLRLLPFHAASQLVHLLPLAPAPCRPWRILEILDTPGDPALFTGVGEALAVATHAVLDRTELLAAPAVSHAAAAEPFDLIYLHPGCDTRAEFRALLAALEPRLAPDGLLWLQAIDPIFAPASLPPAGRTLPALSALLAELDPVRWQVALRCQRAIFAPEFLIHRATAVATARWTETLLHFARGFPHQAFESAGWCGLPAPTSLAATPARSTAATPLAITLRDGLSSPQREATGRFYRPVIADPATPPRVVVTVNLCPAEIPAAPTQPPPWLALRVTLVANPDAGPLALDWLGLPAWRCVEREPSPQDLPPGRQVQVWVVARFSETGFAHAVLHATNLQRLYALQIDALPATVALDSTCLPRDIVSRHRPVVEHVAALPVAGSTMLDVGGAPGFLAALLPHHSMTIVDTAHAAEHAGFLRLPALPAPPAVAIAQPLRLPFADAWFDTVVAIDVLEHIPPAQREAFIAECARVTRTTLWIACPVDSPAARTAEAALAAALVSAPTRAAAIAPPAPSVPHAAREANVLPTAHEFLDEHRRFGLPATADIERWFANANHPVTATTPGATVGEWLQNTAADLGLPANAIHPPATPAASEVAIEYRRNFRWTAASP